MIRWMVGVVAALWLWAGVPAHAQNQEFVELGQAERLQDRVVRVLPRRLDGSVAGSQGFGLIVGTKGNNLIIATPRHVVWQDGYSNKPFVRFHSAMLIDREGTRFPASLPGRDLAVIEVPRPEGMVPASVPLIAEDGLIGRYVWAIGTGEEWLVSPRAGRYYDTNPDNDEMRFGALDTVPGSSGGAIVTARGIAAMILRTNGRDTYALPLSLIQRALPRWQMTADLIVPESGVPVGSVAQVPSVPAPPPGSETPGPAVGGAGTLPPTLPATGSEIRDCDTCPVMVLLPAGDFTMGVTAKEEEDEKVPADFRGQSDPPHKVTIARPFYMAKYAVTRGEYAAFIREMGERPSQDGCWNYDHDNAKNWQWTNKPQATWRNPGFGELTNPDNHPVVCVSYDDARAYVEWLRKKSGRPDYDLPSEAQWEYAARAVRSAVTASPARYWGTGQACDHANVADASLARKLGLSVFNDGRLFQCDDKYPFTAPVGSFAPNRFGLHDMLGNVWQWTEDCWHADYRAGAPVDGSPWNKTGDCVRRVVRGGSWDGLQWFVRTGRRVWGYSVLRFTSSGFRVTRISLPL